MHHTRTSIMPNDRSGNGPVSPLSPNSPHRPLLSFHGYSMDSKVSTRSLRYHSSRRRVDTGLTQMMMNHRGSILSTASLALISGVRRPLDGDQDELISKKLLKEQRVWSRVKSCIQYTYEKSRFKNILPLLILLVYSVLGGAAIYWIEAPIERVELQGRHRFLNDQKDILVQKVWDIRERRLPKRQAMMTLREAVQWYTISTMYMDGNTTRLPPPTNEIVTRVSVLRKYTDQLARRCWEIRLEQGNRTEVKRKLHTALGLFELYTGVSTEIKPIWTYSNAVFLAVTIYTAIGYGSVAPHTVAGRVATIIYAIIGIPAYLMILHKLGRVFLKLLRALWNTILKFTGHFKWTKSTTMGDKPNEKDPSISGESSNIDENDSNIPVSLAVGVTFVWMLTCAGICCVFFETSWDYFTSFYFFFISLTTIGFGDVTPTHPEYMFLMFGLIIVGLSLVSMCINVVQLKLELLFEEMMLALMEEYEKSGRTIDGDLMMESALFQRGLGFVQMLTLWKRKRRAADGDSDAFADFVLPQGKLGRRGAFMRQLKRRRRARTIGTQTELWKHGDWQHDMPPWIASSFDRRQKRRLQLNESTQTDQSQFPILEEPVLSLSTAPNWPTAGFYPTDTTRSASSSMVTCEENNGHPTIEELDDNENERGHIHVQNGRDRLHIINGRDRVHIHDDRDRIQIHNGRDRIQSQNGRDRVHIQTGRDRIENQNGRDRIENQNGRGRIENQNGRDRIENQNGRDRFQVQNDGGRIQIKNGRDRIPIEIREDDETKLDVSVTGETEESGSSTSPDLIPFIPYIEQEVPLEQEQEQPFRRWSAAEAMSIFANWAANRAREEQSRCSSAEEYDDERQLARFKNTGKLSGRRVTVAGGAPRSKSASLRRLHSNRNKYKVPWTPTLHAVSAMRIESMEPSRNDLRTLTSDQQDSTQSKPRQLLTVDASLQHKTPEKGYSYV